MTHYGLTRQSDGSWICPACGVTFDTAIPETIAPCEGASVDPAPEVAWRDRRPAVCYAGTCSHRSHDGIVNPRLQPSSAALGVCDVDGEPLTVTDNGATCRQCAIVRVGHGPAGGQRKRQTVHYASVQAYRFGSSRSPFPPSGFYTDPR